MFDNLGLTQNSQGGPFLADCNLVVFGGIVFESRHQKIGGHLPAFRVASLLSFTGRSHWTF